MNGQDGLYLKVGNKLVKVDNIKDGIPIIKTESEETTNPDGTTNCTVKVPCLKIQTKINERKI